MKDAVQKRQRTLNNMTDALIAVDEWAEVKKEQQMMKVSDVTEPTASSDLSYRIVQAMKKTREAMYFVCSFHDVDFRELVDG